MIYSQGMCGDGEHIEEERLWHPSCSSIGPLSQINCFSPPLTFCLHHLELYLVSALTFHPPKDLVCMFLLGCLQGIVQEVVCRLCLNWKRKCFLYVCIYNVYRPYLRDHFVITSFASEWWMKGGLDALHPACCKKRYEENNKDSFDTEAKVRYEEKKRNLLALLLVHASHLRKPGLMMSPFCHQLRSLTLFFTCCNSWKVHSGETILEA